MEKKEIFDSKYNNTGAPFSSIRDEIAKYINIQVHGACPVCGCAYEECECGDRAQ